MPRFNMKITITDDTLGSEVSNAVDAAIVANNLVNNTALTTALADKANASDVSVIADDLLSTVGRKLVLAPANITGTGGAGTETDIVTALTMPAGLSLLGGCKYRVSGTILCRTPGGSRIAQINLRNQVMMYSAYSAWNGTAAGNGDYDTGARVTNDGHAWQSTINNNNNEPTVASHTGWTDLGAGVTAGWDEVAQGVIDVDVEAGSTTYFADNNDLPVLGSTAAGTGLALHALVIDSQTVRIEFDGSIADIGVN